MKGYPESPWPQVRTEARRESEEAGWAGGHPPAEARLGLRAVTTREGLRAVRAFRPGARSQPCRSNHSQVQAKAISTPNTTAPNSRIEASKRTAEHRGRKTSDRAMPQVKIPLAARAKLTVIVRFVKDVLMVQVSWGLPQAIVDQRRWAPRHGKEYRSTRRRTHANRATSPRRRGARSCRNTSGARTSRACGR